MKTGAVIHKGLVNVGAHNKGTTSHNYGKELEYVHTTASFVRKRNDQFTVNLISGEQERKVYTQEGILMRPKADCMHFVRQSKNVLVHKSIRDGGDLPDRMSKMYENYRKFRDSHKKPPTKYGGKHVGWDKMSANKAFKDTLPESQSISLVCFAQAKGNKVGDSCIFINGQPIKIIKPKQKKTGASTVETPVIPVVPTKIVGTLPNGKKLIRIKAIGVKTTFEQRG